ncbi:hypothetical protein AHAS_Ahas12G0219700 [Arachis hypogaea]
MCSSSVSSNKIPPSSHIFFVNIASLLRLRVQTSSAAKLIHLFSWQFLNVARVNHPNPTLDVQKNSRTYEQVTHLEKKNVELQLVVDDFT